MNNRPLGWGLLACMLFFSAWIYAQPKIDARFPIDQKDNVYTVKQYDEFLERFNFDQKTPLIKHLRQACPGCPVSHQDVLISLFDTERIWRSSQVDSFIQDVASSENPIRLRFSDPNWYIKLDCVFDYDGTDIPGELILENNYFRDIDASRWEIAGVRIKKLPMRDGLVQESPSRDLTKIITPTAHETGFAGLKRALKNRKDLANYFTRRNWSKSLLNFYHALKSGKLCVESVVGLEYHLLQTDNWIVTLQDFHRNLPNSGLLVADIQPATWEQKQAYLRERLYIR